MYMLGLQFGVLITTNKVIITITPIIWLVVHPNLNSLDQFKVIKPQIRGYFTLNNNN
jgi:hypothetical protein